MIKNIIFDIGNVIAYIDYNETLEKMIDNEEDRKFILDNVLNAPEWKIEHTIDIGYYDLDSFISIIGDRTNNTKDDLINYYMHEHYKFLRINTKVLELIKELKEKNYNIYILSNLNKEAHDVYLKTNLFNLVDGYVLSYKEHKVKPNQGIYKTLINRYNLVPEESIFIDDRLDNCETAKSLGMDYINVNKNDYDDLVNKLREREVL